MPATSAVLEVAPGIWRVVNRVFQSNTYICSTGEGGDCFLVDPGTDPSGIEDALITLGMEPRHVFCTHGHFDHVGGAAFFHERYRAPCYLHEADRGTLDKAKFVMMAFHIHFEMELPRVSGMGDCPETLGGKKVTILHTPGHTPGSCMIGYGAGLFSGDTLFSDGVGLSTLPEGDLDALKASLLNVWSRIPDDALVCPGHGDCAPFSRIRNENVRLLRFLEMADPRDVRPEAV